MSTVENKLDNKKIYTPPVWRLLLVYFVLPITATLVGSFLRYLTDILNDRPEKWLDGSGLLVNAAITWAIVSLLLVGFNHDWFAIEIDGISISGQANFGGRRVILLNELDVERIEQRSMVDKLFASWTIWDIKKNKIVINGWFFQAEQVTDILKTIGFDYRL